MGPFGAKSESSFTDEEIDEAIAEEIELSMNTFEEAPLPATGDPEEIAEYAQELYYMSVACRASCGDFGLHEVALFHLDLNNGTVEFRCPVCNLIQTGDLKIAD